MRLIVMMSNGDYFVADFLDDVKVFILVRSGCSKNLKESPPRKHNMMKKDIWKGTVKVSSGSTFNNFIAIAISDINGTCQRYVE